MAVGCWLTEAVQQEHCGLPTPQRETAISVRSVSSVSQGSYSHHPTLPGFLCAQQRAPAPRVSAFPGSRSPLTAETASRDVSVTLC